MYEGIEGAIKIALIDMILVFVILGLLALLMIGLKEIVKLASRKESGIKKVAIPEKDRIIPEKQDHEEIITAEQEGDGQLIAVLSAAVASLMERPLYQVKIINIKRSIPSGANPWTISGKQNLMSKRILISSRERGGF
jgi:Na+-transporting methylmalonyl-CoA/oxaloacetate decarboxylase gamma subunit